ncbi:unnamed protein product [Pleuronectes platessa]|uniref:Uncharacterized protein n=1 Tax=Pleuronectes platessa TaxID=8262 RepID=A0A9N7VIR6_PLEPL|nr:unnamed protein product [Pleuronectes platessa]
MEGENVQREVMTGELDRVNRRKGEGRGWLGKGSERGTPAPNSSHHPLHKSLVCSPLRRQIIPSTPDPADAERFRQALSSQGNRVGQHEKALHLVMEALHNLTSNVALIVGHMEQLSVHLTTLTAPSLTPAPAPLPAASPGALPTQPREPFIPTPARITGQLGSDLQSFIGDTPPGFPVILVFVGPWPSRNNVFGCPPWRLITGNSSLPVLSVPEARRRIRLQWDCRVLYPSLNAPGVRSSPPVYPQTNSQTERANQDLGAARLPGPHTSPESNMPTTPLSAPPQETDVALPSVQEHLRHARPVWREARAALVRTAARNLGRGSLVTAADEAHLLPIHLIMPSIKAWSAHHFVARLCRLLR